MGNRRLGRKRLKAVQQQNYNKSDAWGFVRPAMVPGFSRNVRVIALDSWGTNGDDAILDVAADGATTSVWMYDNENTATKATHATHADFNDGCVTMGTGGAASDMTGLISAAAPFTCTTNKPWWVETSINLTDIDKVEMFFGLFTSGAWTSGENIAVLAAGASHDTAGFCKNVHTTGAIKVRQNKDGDGSIDRSLTSAVTLAADTDVLTMAIHWDGTNTISYYAAKASTGSEVGALPLVLQVSDYVPSDDMQLILQLCEGAGAGAAETMNVNYLRGAWTI